MPTAEDIAKLVKPTIELVKPEPDKPKLTPKTLGGLPVTRMADRRFDFLNLLLYGDPGVGKGQPVNAAVLTPSGWREIGSLQVGDYVVGAYGLPVKVTGVYPRGILPTYRVTFTDKTSLVVDGDHLWKTRNHNSKRRYKNRWEVLSTNELAERLHQRWEIPLVEPIAFERTNTLDGYLLGVLLGDGSLGDVTPSFTPGDELVPKEVQKVLPPDGKLTRTDQETRATTFRVLSSTVRAELIATGLHGKHSFDKFVPTQYLYTSVEQRLALLQGLLDTDGEQGKNKEVIFSTASPLLADAVKFLAESLGGTARISLKTNCSYQYKGERLQGRDSIRVGINLPPELAPFRARKYIAKEKYFPYRGIKSIEPSLEQEVVCIEVDSSDGLYVTERCIVTHNTTFIATASLIKALSPVLLINVEGGDLSLMGYPDVEVVRVTSYEQMTPIYNELYRGKHPYRTVGIDNLTELRYFSMSDIMVDAVANNTKQDPDVPSQREWGKNSNQIRAVVRGFRDLPMHTIFTSHAKEVEDSRAKLFKVKPALPGQLSDEVAGFVDLVLYYYIKMVGNEHKRLMLTTKTATTNAKDRSGKLPAVLEEPNMEALINLIMPHLTEKEETE